MRPELHLAHLARCSFHTSGTHLDAPGDRKSGGVAGSCPPFFFSSFVFLTIVFCFVFVFCFFFNFWPFLSIWNVPRTTRQVISFSFLFFCPSTLWPRGVAGVFSIRGFYLQFWCHGFFYITTFFSTSNTKKNYNPVKISKTLWKTSNLNYNPFKTS